MTHLTTEQLDGLEIRRQLSDSEGDSITFVENNKLKSLIHTAREVETLKTALKREQEAFNSLRKGIDEEIERADDAEEGLREICLLFGFDPSDGEGTAPSEVVALVTTQTRKLQAAIDGLKDIERFRFAHSGIRAHETLKTIEEMR
jgi:hypothetical protein